MSLRNFVIRVVALLAACLSVFGQVERPLKWLEELDALMVSSSSVEQRAEGVVNLRKQVTEWAALHPTSHLDLASPTASSWNEELLKSEIASLRQAIEDLIKNDPDQPFTLGVTVVNVNDTAAALSPVFDTLNQIEIRNNNALMVSQAINYLPGVAVDHKSPRNQAGIAIGGFDSRQVPLLLDGIPAYMPFDGYVDLNRYLTSDISEVQVAKFYSSPLLGPNALGGVINLVTRQPERKLEGDAFIGTGSGRLLNSGLHLGSRWRRVFFQSSLDWLQSNWFPVSGNFQLSAIQPVHRRINSDQRDEQYRGRIGWTPRGDDSYVFSYTNQKGTTGIPPYSGSAPLCPGGAVPYPCVTPKYWRWPKWNSNSYYFNSSTRVGEMSTLRLRAFYAVFPNVMEMYDNASYSIMIAASSNIQSLEDHTTGASGEFLSKLVPRNELAASIFVNRTTHTERTTTFSTPNVPTTSPTQTDRDLQTSFGAQDVVTLTRQLRATLGFSADHLNGLWAEDLNTDRTTVVPFQVQGICTATTATSFDSCTNHVWTYNPVGSLSYSTAKSGTLFVTFAEKSRFPTLKDRYSYKAGRAVPNPALRPERARNWSAGYSRMFGARTVVQADFFHSAVRNEIENIFFLSPLCAASGSTGGGGGRGGVGSCQQAVNVGREAHQGANFTIRTTPISRVTFDANYTFLNRTVIGNPAVFPVGTPKHKTVGRVTIRLPHGATGIASAQYQSGAVGMSDNGFALPPAKFATMDLAGFVPIRARVSLQAGVKNLLGRNYFYWEGFPEAGRTWYVTVRYRF